MQATQQFSIILPEEVAEVVCTKVAAGEYSTESEVILEGLRMLIAHDHAIEQWLRGYEADAMALKSSHVVRRQSATGRSYDAAAMAWVQATST